MKYAIFPQAYLSVGEKFFIFDLQTCEANIMAKGAKILVIDDSNTNVVLLDVVLQKEGYEVITASSAREALAYLEKDKPDLILLDILMPQTNGLELLEKIRQEPKLADLPVIMITAVGNENYKEKAQKLGAVDYFEKPIDVTQVIKKIKSVL
ncbi:MAG TPA: response regulator [Bacteroidetes bacterium]|nr:response regulator [Bacteroidota bacterium]